jgi:putative ABC transport system permease protein
MAKHQWQNRVARRLRALLHGEAMDRELEEEIRLHIALETEDLIRTQGVSPEEARRQAMVAFGGLERYRGEHRDVRGVGWIERPLQDLRYALRGMKRSPGFAVAVVLTLALGIGANTAMFSVVDRLLFRAPPMMPHPDRVHQVYLSNTFRGKEYTNWGVQYKRYVDLTQFTRSFTRTALYTQRQLAIGAGEVGREMSVGAVSASFFGLFDASPALGRYFTTAEDEPPDGTPVAVLGYGYWQTRYGGRTNALGQHVKIGATTYTVVGVAPEGFVGLWPDAPPAAFIPIAAYGAEMRSRLVGLPADEDWWTTYHWTWARMLAERKPGVTVAAANADLTRAYVRSYRIQLSENPHATPLAESNPHAEIASVLSDRGPKESSTAKVATWISGVALIVWLIACANVANLLLARAMRRRREIAVRLALGIGRGRLAAQLLTESVLLALMGGVAGVAVAQWGGALLRARLLSKTSTATVVGDPRTLLFAGAAAVIAGFLAGLAPLLQTRRTSLTRELREGAREGTYQRSATRVALLVLQATLSATLLVGAGLFVRSLLKVRTVPLGYDVAPVAVVDLNMRGVVLDSAQKVTLRQRLLDAARTIPGVESAALQRTMPFWSTWDEDLHVAGIDSVSRLGEFDLNAVSPGYFATMGTRILRGRGITDEDVAGAPGAMVVSEAMARKLWPDKDAVGQCVRVGADTVPCTYVVGIAEDIKNSSLSDDPSLYYYVASAQMLPDQGGLFIRTRGDVARSTEIIRRTLQRVMPGGSYVTVTPMSDVLGSETQSWQLGATMFVIFGILALVLAAIGLYGVIAYNVAQRFHELGVRVALGAGAPDLVRLVLSQGMRVATIGLVLGVAIALAAGRWLKPLLFQESPHDPVVLGIVAAVLLGVAALASFIPALRAAHVDPVRALRTE